MFNEDMREYHRKIDNEFHKLCCEPSQKIPKLGQRVIVAAGLLGMGHLWIREEAIVEEVGEVSIKVRFTNYKPFNGERGSHELWIHPALITDVLND